MIPSGTKIPNIQNFDESIQKLLLKYVNTELVVMR